MVDVVLFGVSNMIGVIIDCAQANGHRVTRVVLNQPELLRPRTRSVRERFAALSSAPELLDIDDYSPRAGEMHLLGTTSPARSTLVAELDRRFCITLQTIVHPTAYVSPLARLGRGVFVGALSYIAPDAEIAEHALILSGAIIGHDVQIGPFVRVSSGCRIAGHVRVGAAAIIGMSATVIEERDIGEGAIIAAGSVVVNDVPAGATVIGVPARIAGSVGS